MNYRECLDWLFSQLPMYQRVGSAAYKADLSNTRKLMDILQHPEVKFKSVHVAGTNGKGSVCHMLAAIFQKSGYKTGLYTSPHLKDFRERIRINGQVIPEREVVTFVEKYKDDFPSPGLSFFEMTVGMAFQYFAKEGVDIAIIETGMGGRLDSTNVLNPELSIITNISLDHTQFLGNTKALIAIEKAGIIKPGIPVIIGERNEETDAVFTQIASEKDAEIAFAEDLIPPREIQNLDLKGIYQEKNVRTVWAAIAKLKVLGYQFSGDPEDAVNNTATLTGLRGRWEQIGEQPKIICDTGHNVAGVSLILQQLRNEHYKNLHIVWGMVGDKDASSILALLPEGAHYYWCKPDLPRGKDVEELKTEGMKFGLKGVAYPSVISALEAARQSAHPEDLIFIGGSTFVVAEVI